MAITIDEKFDSREATESESPNTELLYVVQGTDDDLLVKSLVAATAPASRARSLTCSESNTPAGSGNSLKISVKRKANWRTLAASGRRPLPRPLRNARKPSPVSQSG